MYKKVDFINTSKILPLFEVSIKIFFNFSPFIFENYLNNKILKQVNNKYDLIYVKSGEYIGEKLILELKKKTKKIIYFCNDNPFVERDKKRWLLFHKSSKYYDSIIYQDKSRINLSKKKGLKNGKLLNPTYEKSVHKKWKVKKNEIEKFSHEIVFIGTWSPKKANFLIKLKKLGAKVKIYGTRWNKDPNYKLLKSIVKLGHVKNPTYSKIIQCSKIALCLFSEENLDTITARTIEIPAIGTLLMCKKTNTVKNLYNENEEAVFFKTPIECFKKCNYYLRNSIEAKKIAKKGQDKVTRIYKMSNENFIKKIISLNF